MSSRDKKRMKTDRGVESSDNARSNSRGSQSNRERTPPIVNDRESIVTGRILEGLDEGKDENLSEYSSELEIHRRQLHERLFGREYEIPIPASPHPEIIIISDSDDQDTEEWTENVEPEADMSEHCTNFPMQDPERRQFIQDQLYQLFDKPLFDEPELANSEREDDGSDDESQLESEETPDVSFDDLGDVWSEMAVAMECAKDVFEPTLHAKNGGEGEEDCDHSFIFKDDIGDVCRICGVIRRPIETIVEYNFSKAQTSSRTRRYGGRNPGGHDQSETLSDGLDLPNNNDLIAADMHPHPRHRREMKPHQVEGFNFLASNVMSENPGGCIMAHAPGSGKTFMIISFLQSFMAKYPAARPLVVLPRGILPIWKKEFLTWQIEEIPLYDFYSVKADNRGQQLEVLKEWAERRSILFLGYKQFSSIVCDVDDRPAPLACKSYLLKVPSIVILDEGHTPRNPDTAILRSLGSIETTRKVVLSGTLYQNSVREVFSILDLVRPNFLMMEDSKIILRRIVSRAEISSSRNLSKLGRGNGGFYKTIEDCLIKDENRSRKVALIQDLREMTRKVLHYYKGDNLEELPGLVDLAVFLELSPAQRSEVEEMKNLQNRFAISALASPIYVHPILKEVAKNSGGRGRVDEGRIHPLLEKLDIRDGAKLSFYINLLQLCESTGEKLIVFGNFLLPLKFLEIMTSKLKGYSVGREMFVITGDSDTDARESVMEQFNQSPAARVFFGSVKACGEGISLIGASRILILDVHLNPSVTRQAIGRAFRPGQTRKVYTYRLIATGSLEEADHAACFKKESIANMWFEWDERRGQDNFEMEPLHVDACGDMFLETPLLKENVAAVYRR
ncbi:protein CHROMATIN REMODELING 35-like [Andrographis paniculata]|uniref:protein CHROMATIN REMODELING 35-like n=1 Tax=Andrographis paniculata TaxID=175694 RepID=UPI0021E88194|nr:protein CHROMATIN REMODELING 35-like [Andrographis paniculata]